MKVHILSCEALNNHMAALAALGLLDKPDDYRGFLSISRIQSQASKVWTEKRNGGLSVVAYKQKEHAIRARFPHFVAISQTTGALTVMREQLPYQWWLGNLPDGMIADKDGNGVLAPDFSVPFSKEF